MTEADQIVKYVRLNLSTLKALLNRPDASRAVIKKLTAECPKGEIADLIAPLVIQRAQNTIQESGLKRSLGAVLTSMPAEKEEKEFQQEQIREQQRVTVRTGARKKPPTTSPVVATEVVRGDRITRFGDVDLGSPHEVTYVEPISKNRVLVFYRKDENADITHTIMPDDAVFMVIKSTPKTGSLTPWSLRNFRDDHTNQVAAELFDQYDRQFPDNIGKAIALTRRDLNRTDLDLSAAPPKEREFVPLPSKPKPVRQPEHSSLFSRDEIKYSAEDIRTQKGTPIRRSGLGVGKDIGGAVYLHRQYASALPDQNRLHEAEQHLPDGFDWNVVKATKDGTFTFFNSPDFDTAPEPTGGDYILVGRGGWLKEGHTNSIWHHKWLWVRDDYTGFDVEKSKQRSRQWTALPDIDYNRIGNKQFWEQNVVPRLQSEANGFLTRDQIMQRNP